MSDSHVSQPSDDRQSKLERVLADYLHSVEQRQPLDRSALIAAHPDLANDLQSFFHNHDSIGRLAVPLNAAAAEAPTITGMLDLEPVQAGMVVRYFGDYELLDEIARGGMGVVFKARQVNLNRIVALKMILAGQLANDSDVKRFYAEAEAAARLDHPGIVPIFEIGQHDGQHYFSMAYIEGESLAKKIANGPLPPREAAKLVKKVAEAVEYAHRKGIVHRDLKPANVLLDGQGQPKVTDFGLAKLLKGDSGLTGTGQILGTPSYMPPEQAEGQVDQIGPQADVYALGAILYCLLTGRPPFQAANPIDTLLQVIHQEPLSPRALNPTIPRDLDTICLKCLEKDSLRRYPSAQELADELERFSNDEPIQARPPAVAERAWRWLRKQRRSVGLTAAAVAATLVVSLLGLSAWLWYQDWRLGYLMLKTDRPPLVAELLDTHGNQAAPTFTVPTQEPIAVGAGDYRLLLSAAGRLSQTYGLSIKRGSMPSQFSLNLDDQLLGPGADGNWSLNVERSYALVMRQGRADVVLLDARGIRRPAWPGSGETWSVNLEKPADNPVLREAPGLLWPWKPLQWNSTEANLRLHPQVVRDAPDLDGDGVEDLIVAARHQAWILAASSRDGRILWLAARGSDVANPPGQPQGALAARNSSAVLGSPAIASDLNGDGVPELVATFVDEGPNPQAAKGPLRWVECLSGKTGRPLWRFDLDDSWFQLPAGVEMPESGKWLVHGSYSLEGGSGGSNFDDKTRTPWRLRVSGLLHLAPYPARIVRASGSTLVLVVAGTRAVRIDLATGKPAGEQIDFGLPPVREPQLADLDGDGDPELVLVQSSSNAEATAGGPTGSGSSEGRLKLTAWSLKSGTRLWQRALEAEFRPPNSTTLVSAGWPVIDDLDADGRSEVIVPGNALVAHSLKNLWAEVEVLNGETGQSRWRRLLKTMDQQIDYFLAGPDVNGDGHREVFVVTLTGTHYDLYVDALSGKDGSTLWWSSRRIGPQESSIDGVAWWHPGDDGWPRVLVATAPQRGQSEPARLSAFSAGTGQFAGIASQIDEIHFADGDGDGLEDLFALQRSDVNNPEQGGRLQALRGAANERWRRLGAAWRAGADYDGDGQDDLVAVSPGNLPSLTAISGSDGRQLWQTPLESALLDSLQPLAVDLDGDQTPDVLAITQRQRWGFASVTRRFPVAALSGRTGASLWSVEMPFRNISQVLFADTRDLDGDGLPEVIFSVFTDWDYPLGSWSNTSLLQHWLAVVDGRRGSIRWRQPLSVAYGLPGAPNHFAYSTQLIAGLAAYTDLDHDGITDVVLPAETADAPSHFELRAHSGVNGKILWRRPCPPTVVINEALHEIVTPTVADLDGDGLPELIGLEYISVQPAEGGQQRRVRLYALDPASGRERWNWQLAVEGFCGTTGGDADRYANKPRPLVLARRAGRLLLAVGLWNWGGKGRIVVLDHSGKHIGEMPVQSTDVFSFRPWIHDLDGDGNDEMVVLNDGKLQAIQVGDDAGAVRVLWEWLVPPGSRRRIVELHAASAHEPAVVVVQSGATLYGINGTTGRPLWINTGPQPFTAGGGLLATASQTLNSAASGEPTAVFQYADQMTVCRVARRINEGPSVSLPPDATTWRRPSPPALVIAPDPRLVCRTHWAIDRDERVRLAKLTLRGLVVAVLLFLLPGWMLYRLIVRRERTLQTAALALLSVGLLLCALYIPVPASGDPRDEAIVTNRIELAIAFAPLAVFVYLLIQNVRTGHWKRFFGWGAVAVLFAVLFVALHFIAESFQLAPGERQSLTDWDVPLALGFYGAAWVAVVATPFIAAVRTFSKFRARRRESLLPTG